MRQVINRFLAGAGSVGVLGAALVLAAGCSKGADPAPGQADVVGEDPTPRSVAVAQPATDVERRPSPVVPAPDEGEVDPEPEAHDTPHIDRALGKEIEADGDMRAARTFTLNGVPDEVTVYEALDAPGRNVVIIYDEGYDHVATVTSHLRTGRRGELPTFTAEAEGLDPTKLARTKLAAFEVWSSKFAASQSKSGPGQRYEFRGPKHRYVVDTLVALPWLFEGWEFSSP